MKKLFILIAVALISSAAQASDYPTDSKDRRYNERKTELNIKNFRGDSISTSSEISSAPANTDYPTDSRHRRIIRRNKAYGTVVGEAIKGDKDAVVCNYKPGCDKKSMEQTKIDAASYGQQLAYPKHGYVLDADGTYKFKPGVQSK